MVKLGRALTAAVLLVLFQVGYAWANWIEWLTTTNTSVPTTAGLKVREDITQMFKGWTWCTACIFCFTHFWYANLYPFHKLTWYDEGSYAGVLVGPLADHLNPAMLVLVRGLFWGISWSKFGVWVAMVG